MVTSISRKAWAVSLVILAALVVAWLLMRSRHSEPSYESRRAELTARVDALVAKASAEPPDSGALQSLIDLLRNGDEDAKRSAAIGLGRVGFRAAAATDGLARAIQSEDLYLARAASLSIGEIGPAAQGAIPVLIDAMARHPNRDVGWFAAWSLGKIADPRDQRVTELLEHASRSEIPQLKSNALRGLNAMKKRTVPTSRASD